MSGLFDRWYPKRLQSCSGREIRDPPIQFLLLGDWGSDDSVGVLPVFDVACDR